MSRSASSSSSLVSLNIREKVRNTLLKVVDSIGEKDQWKVMIVDEHALQVISSACKVSDLLTKNVTIVENLGKKRQPFPTLDAVYFVTPTADSIDKIIEDYNVPNKPTYGNAHLLFTSRITEELMDKIARSRLHTRVKTFQDVNIDFLAVERPIFTFKQQDDIQQLLNTDTRSREKYSTLVADQLYTFFLTSGFSPYIRYSSDSPISKTVANRVYDLLNKSKESKGLVKDKSIALIIDRTEDANAPLLHEFTYQAMAYDLLNVSPNDNVYEYSYTTGDNQKKTKKVLLDEQYDPVWERFRHTHFAELGKELQKEIDQFLNEHQDISNTQKKEVGKKLDSAEMSDMIRKLPQYQKSLSMYSMHKQINKELLTIFREQSLSKIATEEQNMATGETPDGDKVNAKELMTTIGAILSNSNVSSESKMRLIMLYIVFNQGKLADDKKDKLFRMARLNDEQIETVNNLSLLIRPTKSGISTKLSKLFDTFKKSGQSDKEVGYQLSRYTPKIKDLSERTMVGKLEPEAYPFVNDPPNNFKLSSKDSGKTSSATSSKSSSSSSRSDSTTTDLRSKKNGPTWNKKKTEDDSASSSSSSSTSTKLESNMKLFVFVIGGMTYSETRSCYELMQEHGIDVFFGSTSLITPHSFLEKLSLIRTTD
ncbi:hypothetical protein C9374_002773 [Naegleria lovaniensis]|uniref:Uncharacterized protein n=1 Tax=Naegleria lovaniensis TaxID=51637 RepID=A0AA88GSP7_NAELO|nr:uncharacterized protein C9374_002773 [Naegleria lovaniensis]KAG2386327.1 hypothetical protein C9374_002773 [Naegleria lovaniensis]